MDHLWRTFLKAFNGKINNDNLEFVYQAKEYADLFHKNMPLSDDQLELLKRIIFLVLSDGRTVADISDYFAFLVPIYEIEAALSVHEKIKVIVSSKETSTIKEQIFSCFHRNHVPSDLLHFIEKNTASKDGLFFMISFAYIVNENKNAFLENRETFLKLYREHFSTHNTALKKEWFVTTDLGVIENFKKISRFMNQNEILRLSYSIASKQQQNHTLKSFIEEIGSIYEELRGIFSELKTQMEEAKEKNYEKC